MKTEGFGVWGSKLRSLFDRYKFVLVVILAGVVLLLLPSFGEEKRDGGAVESSQESGSDPFQVEELERKLESWEAAPEEATAICGRLEELGFLNDALYAEQVVRHYSAKGYGLRKLRDELYRRGVPRELWDEALERAEDPAEAIDAFLAKKLGDTPPEDRRAWKRASDALARRGYAWSDISEGLRRYGAEWEE